MQTDDPGGQRMRCLICGKELGYGSIRDIVYGDDPLCMDCRRQWKKKRIRFSFDGYPLYASYIYNEAFSKCLIQYKELADEALKDAFLFEDLKWFRRTFRRRQIVLMPSSRMKLESRGFSHLRKMFECTGMEITEPFIRLDEGSQKQKNRQERMEIENRIILKPDAALNKRIVLCDDTITTGATLKGALNALSEEHLNIRIYTVSANRRWKTDTLHFNI